MRYAFLLLTLCVSFGTLDSVSRHGHAVSSFSPTGASPGRPDLIHSTVFHPVNNIASAVYVVRNPIVYAKAVGRTRLVPPAADGRAVQAAPSGAADQAAEAGGVADAAAVSDAVAAAVPVGITASADEAARMPLPEESLTGASLTQGSLTQVSLTQGVPTQASLTQAPPAPLSAADAFKTAVPLTPAVFSARNKAFAAVMADSIRNSLLDPHGVQFGGLAGLNWSGAAARGTTGKVSGKPLSGLSLGTFADVPLKKQVSFRPTVQYAYEGYQANVSGNNVTIHVAYLGTSLDLVYHTNWLKRRFYWGAGPYWSYAMEGTYTFGGINTDMQFGNNYSTGSYLRKTDYGAGGTAGLLMDRNFVLGARFDLGLKDIAATGLHTPVHTRSFGLSVLYVFRNKIFP